VKAKGRSKLSIDKNQAFEPGVKWGEDVFAVVNLSAAGKQNSSSLDGAFKTLSRRLADFRCNVEFQVSAISGAENRLRQRMFGISFQAGGGG